jgi:hypothetical protein
MLLIKKLIHISNLLMTYIHENHLIMIIIDRNMWLDETKITQILNILISVYE